MIVTEGKTFKPAPAGMFAAVIVDVVDRGDQPGKFGMRHKVELRWLISATSPETSKPFTVARWFTASMNGKSALRKFLDAADVHPRLTPQGYDLESLIGETMTVQVRHGTREDGSTSAYVEIAVPLLPGTSAPSPEGYVRKKDRGE